MPAPTITPLPTPPSRSTDPTNFAIEADAFVAALPEFVTDANAQASYLDGLASTVDGDATAAAASAAAAFTSENNAEAAAAAAAASADVVLWVSGTTYAVGNNVFSPLNYQTYRRKTNGAGTTDPSLDGTNWELLTFYALTPLSVIGNSTAGAELRLPEDTDNGNHYVSLKAPSAIAANLTLTLPTADGTSGQLLQTNGSGQLSFNGISSPFSILGNASAGAEIRLPEDTDNGVNYIALKAPNNIAANLTLTLPTADGTVGQFLKTDGSGNLSFGSAGAAIGSFLTVTPGADPGVDYILANNAVVLQSAYPLLYAMTGLQPMAASSFDNFGLGSASFPPTVMASNRTNLVMVIKSDGTVWTGNRTSGFTQVGTAGLGGVATSLNHFGGTWVATSATSPFLRYSTNAGVTWTTPATAPTNALHRAVYANDRWVALSNTGSSWSATAIGSWSTISGISGAYDCAYGNGKWVIVRNSGQLSYSSNFSSWTTATIYGAATGNNIVFTGKIFIAAYDSAFYVSTDGVNFGRGAASGGTIPVNSLCLLENGHLVYRYSGAAYGMTSNGFSVTSSITTPGSNQFNWPVYLDGYVYAAFSTNEFITSFPFYPYNRSTEFVIPSAPHMFSQYLPSNSLVYVKAT